MTFLHVGVFGHYAIIVVELALEGEEVIRPREKHYRLVDRREISPFELTLYKTLQLD